MGRRGRDTEGGMNGTGMFDCLPVLTGIEEWTLSETIVNACMD